LRWPRSEISTTARMMRLGSRTLAVIGGLLAELVSAMSLRLER
jgi:hypothetical protein